MNTFMLLFLLSQQVTPESILDHIRENLSYSTSRFTAQIEIRKGKRVLTKNFSGYSKGDNFYIEFTNPEDRGVKYLKLRKDLYVYLPDIDDVVRMSGDMLKQSFMGSDLSYEDLVQEDPLRFYKPTSLSDTTIEGSSLYVLELEDTTGTAPYFRIRMLVDKKNKTWVKEELYTKSGRKLKEVEALEYRTIGGKYYPVAIIMKDLRLKDSYTKFVMSGVSFDMPVPQNIFRLEFLKK